MPSQVPVILQILGKSSEANRHIDDILINKSLFCLSLNVLYTFSHEKHV